MRKPVTWSSSVRGAFDRLFAWNGVEAPGDGAEGQCNDVHASNGGTTRGGDIPSADEHMKISPLADIHPDARVDEDAFVGPFCVVGPEVEIGSGTRLLSNVVLIGRVIVGRNNLMYPNVVIGAPPQDRGYRDELAEVRIGDNNIFREAATIHRGTPKGGGLTLIADNNYLMVNAHCGHDTRMGSGCTLANNVMLAGHVHVGNNVVMGGGVGVHQFVTIGDFAFIGGYSRLHHDVPPFCKVDGADLVRGINSVGLARAGFSAEDIEALETACRRLFYHEKPFAAVMAEYIRETGLNRYVRYLIDYLRRRDTGRHGRYLESFRGKPTPEPTFAPPP